VSVYVAIVWPGSRAAARATAGLGAAERPHGLQPSGDEGVHCELDDQRQHRDRGVYELINSGSLRLVRIDGARRIKAADLEAFVASLSGEAA
jgi:hypothetical protein